MKVIFVSGYSADIINKKGILRSRDALYFQTCFAGCSLNKGQRCSG